MMKPKNEQSQIPAQDRLPYIAPEIILELDLETRAGTPLGIGGSDPLDLTGLGTDEFTP